MSANRSSATFHLRFPEGRHGFARAPRATMGGLGGARSPPCRSVYVPAQLVFDVNADDLVERALASEAEGQRAARVEAARPAGHDARDHRIRLAANARRDLVAGHPRERFDLL